VCELRRKFYAVQTADEEVLGRCPGKFFHAAGKTEEFPAIGDWVAVRRRPREERAEIFAVLPRRTKFSRRAAGDEAVEQVVAANVDVVFLVSGLDRSHNAARVQRFLVAARESGAEPVVLLNKSDLRGDADAVVAELENLLPNVRVLLTSAVTRKGLVALGGLLKRGVTAAFVGSSGVGKSSLVNALLRDELMPTTEVREKDSKGRHTTTRRELVPTPSGAVIIDTPGMRELQLWEAGAGLGRAFEDVRELAARCRFTNCSHGTEPGCAVREALDGGGLSASRWADFLKLRGQAGKPKALSKKAASDNRVKWRKLNAERDAWKQRLD
jgi:ribosome biogenesis GTPase